jgi:hypothetical protein
MKRAQKNESLFPDLCIEQTVKIERKYDRTSFRSFEPSAGFYVKKIARNRWKFGVWG